MYCWYQTISTIVLSYRFYPVIVYPNPFLGEERELFPGHSYGQIININRFFFRF